MEKNRRFNAGTDHSLNSSLEFMVCGAIGGGVFGMINHWDLYWRTMTTAFHPLEHWNAKWDLSVATMPEVALGAGIGLTVYGLLRAYEKIAKG